MRDIQITADNHRLFLVELMQIGSECILPRHPVVNPLQTVLRVRRIAGDQEKRRIFQRDDASLMVKRFYSDTVGNILRRVLCKYCRAGIAFFLCRIPELLIAGEVKLHLMRLCLRLLQTEKIGVQRVENFLKALLHAGANSVDIP